MTPLRQLLIGISNRTNRFVGAHWGEAFPFWYVCAYPKSGSTWLAKMISDYLEIPFPQFTIMPMGCQCLLQNHWPYHPGLRRVFYLYRDGRDVVVSHYFFQMRRLKRNPNGRFERRIARRFNRAFGPGYDPDDIARHLPKFIEMQMTAPPSRFVGSWPEHIQKWYDPSRKHIAYLSYESLRSDPLAALKPALENFLDEPVDEDRLGRSIERYVFERMAGRKAGIEDRTAFARKGITGDWVNHFTREAGEIFDQHAGRMLVDLGYEPDRSWVQNHQFLPSPT